MKDVLPPDDHRTIRSISVPPNRRHIAHAQETQRPRRTRRDEEDEFMNPKRKGGSRFIWIVAIIVLAVLGTVGASIIFKKATVVVTPKSQNVTLPSVLTAYADAPLGELQFQTVTTTNVGEKTVPASGETNVEKRATGTITILNEYSTATQRLIKNTRFEAPDGKIYRLDQSVVVPGGTKKASGGFTAGSIDAAVSADSPGDTYNRGLDSYTISGFKGDPRYTKIYAKGKTPIAGGFVGTQKIVAPADLSAAKSAIENDLAVNLSTALGAATPPGYVIVPQSTYITYDELPQAGNATAAVISMRGTAVAAMVREADLASAIAKVSGVEGYAGEALRFADLKKVTMTAKATATPGLKSLAISLSGSTLLIWEVDGDAIKKALVGTRTSDLLSILTRFKPAVSDAKASMRPFWESSFPTDPTTIEVTVKDPS